MNNRVLFIAALSFALLFTGCSRKSYSTVIVEFLAPPGVSAVDAIRAQLPKNDPSVVVTAIRNTNLIQIGVYDRDAQNAASRANAFAVAAQNALIGDSSEKRFKIWERAEPFPN